MVTRVYIEKRNISMKGTRVQQLNTKQIWIPLFFLLCSTKLIDKYDTQFYESRNLVCPFYWKKYIALKKCAVSDQRKPVLFISCVSYNYIEGEQYNKEVYIWYNGYYGVRVRVL